MKDVNFIDGLVIEKRNFNLNNKNKIILLINITIILICMLYIPYIKFKNLEQKEQELKKINESVYDNYNNNILNDYYNVLKKLIDKKIYLCPIAENVYKCIPEGLIINSMDYKNKVVTIKGEVEDYSTIVFFIDKLQENYKNELIRLMDIEYTNTKSIYSFNINIFL
ncbi:MAG: PilN domain-containing protein [Caloramator sp.]|nr:PilN domain-containing protein [Caloramator sp.]